MILSSKLKTVGFFVLIVLFTACRSSDGNYKNINGTQLYYRTIGQGEPIIVIHGGPVLSHHYLYSHLKTLADQYKLVFYDQRLSGRSSADVDTADITLQKFVEDIEELRKSLDLGDVTVLGHSWGGLLAMKYAIDYPQHLKKLILADPMPASAELWQQEEIDLASRQTAADRREIDKALSSEAYRQNKPYAIKKVQMLSFENQFHDSAFVDSLDLYVPNDYAKRSRLFGNLMPDLRDYDLFPALTKVQAPTLILYGSDEPAGELSGKKLYETMLNAKLEIIPKSGHFPFIEQPQAFFAKIREFLGE